MTVQPPKGTRDFFPEDQRIQNHIFSIWRKACLRFGYEEYDGPMFEHLELYTGKSGEEIVSQLYHFTDKGGRALALRPEMTPTLARMINSRGSALRKPLRWFSIPRLFRYERAQKGRLREFYQLNMDIIGADTVYAEADLLLAIISMLKDFGLSTEDFIIGVSSRKLLAAYLEDLGITNADAVYPLLDRKAKISPDAFIQELGLIGLSAQQIHALNTFMNCRTLESVRSQSLGTAASNALNELESLFSLLQAAKALDCVQLDLSVVRGLAYYTGIVFEVFDRKRSMRAVAGGGRYDSLTERLGGAKVPCVGFGMGDVVLADLLRERALLPETQASLDIWIATFTGNMRTVFEIAMSIRSMGCSCSHALSPVKIGKQLEQAHHAGAYLVIFVDGERALPGEYEYKNLRTGTQGCGTLKFIAEVLNEYKSISR